MQQGSFWLQGEPKIHPLLRGRRTADVVVVGGGLTGLTAGLWLCRAGLRVALLEAATLGSGTSSRCAGRVSLSGGLLYDRLEQGRGQEVAAAYALTQHSALQALRELAGQRDAPSGWRDEDAFLVSQNESELTREAEAMGRAGVPAEVARATQSPLPAAYALRLKGMATLHPMKHLRYLAEEGQRLGMKIYEHSRVIALETNLAYTERGSVLAPYIVVATGYPVVNTPGWYFLRLSQRQSCLIPLEQSAPFEGMYLDAHGAYALSRLKDGMLLQMNGKRVGEGPDSPQERFAAQYAPYLGGEKAPRFFDGLECYSADGLPYIGAYGRKTPNLFVATGYGGRGLLGGMVAAQAISAKVLGLPGEGYAVYSGQRGGGAVRGAELKTALGMGRRYAAGLLRFGAPRCPHMGCRLRYRPQTRLWECPCHGSRFDDIGHVLNAPAIHDAAIRHRRRG